MRFVFSIFFLSITFLAHSQGPRVPSVIEFAGMKLHINSAAQRQIQADVDNLRRHDTYFRKKLQKVDLHFPIIERVFKEENIPDDFKYLVIQESALVSDAVSSSNAVGFWQFKKETALEMNLRVDNLIDERLNLVSSSRAAAGYLKKNNFYFDNWIYALLAYNTGRGGAEKYIKEKDFGKRKMDITGNTHWYVKKFLAHMVAFRDEVGKGESSPYFLFEYTQGGGKDLREISREFNVDQDLVIEYNKCFKKKKIPNDKTYVALVPIGFDQADQIAKNNNKLYEPSVNSKDESSSIFSLSHNGSRIKSYYSEADQFPAIKNTDSKNILIVNGKKGTIAKPGDNFDVLAVTGDLTLDKFLDLNDLTSYDQPIAGQVYYFQKKQRKAKTHYHTLKPGETLWDVSQKYGIRLKKLLLKNRLNSEEEATAGLVLWLRYIRPKNIPPEYHDIRHFQKEIEKQEEIAGVHTVEGIEEPVENRAQESNDEQNDALIDSVEDKPQHIEVFEDSEQDREARKKILTEELGEEETTEEPYPEQDLEIRHHLVRKGETFFSISRQHNVDIVDLLVWNDMKINDILSIGQSLVIKTPKGNNSVSGAINNPVPNVLQANADSSLIIHKVSETDTLYGIAKRYQVTIKQIMEWNEKEDFVIKPNDELKIFLK